MSLRHILSILNPQPAIGGLEISDSAVRFILARENKLIPVSASVNLLAGVVEEGRVKNKEDFKSALLNLHSQITSKKKKKIYAVINISDSNVYSQVFNLPLVAINNIEEAAKLNLQMISPMDFSSAYSDWQPVGESSNDGGQLEILGAFANNKIIDDLVECLRAANFVVAAIEFSSLAISRLVSELPKLPNCFLLLRLTSSGLDFALIKNCNLYFNHFVPWPSADSRKILLSSIKEIIVSETQKILTFSSSHWPDVNIDTFLLATPALEEKISQIITENFHFSVQKIILPLWSMENKKLPSITSDWFVALGSALRGLIPRSKDIFISLAGTGTEEEFRQQQTFTFIKSWRNIILTSFSFILIAFIIADIFLIKTINSLNNQLANFVNLPAEEKVNELQTQAENFNNRVDLALKAKEQVYNWSPFFEIIKNLAGENIAIERVFIQSNNLPILINGEAPDEQTIIDFKNKVEGAPQFTEVNFPLSSVTSAPDGKFNFSITFRLK